MNRFYKWLTIILALLLPWHGAITVFLPDFFRYWKELVLILFFAGFWIIPPLAGEARRGIINFFKKDNFIDTPFKFPLLGGKMTETFAGLFLFYGLILVLFSADKGTALVAFRYLGLGIFVYLLFSLITVISTERGTSDEKSQFKDFSTRHTSSVEMTSNGNFAKFYTKFKKYFLRNFIYSSLASVLFGSWVKFGNGTEFLQNFYSQTISSWVPGQTIPLWHEVGDFIRMQGASSGPIEFSHLLLVALFLTLISKLKNIYKVLFSAIFLFGIYQSYSRAAMLGAIIILIFHSIYPLRKRFMSICKRNIKKIVFIFLILFSAGFWGISQTNVLSRAGTSAHFTRPVEATEFGLANILSNNLGKLGPASRAKNLRENNDDKAMIAENVFVDVFAQMGVIGLFLYLIFFFYLLNNLQPKFRGFFLVALLMMSFATIFDMTPVAISFFAIFWLGRKETV